MRQALVAGNWKMHGSRKQTAQLIGNIIADSDAEWSAEVLVCPTFVYLTDAARLLNDSGIALGAQNVCAEESGAFTGEISAEMLKDIGCRYCIVGHSERRALYGEDDRLVARKFVATQRGELTPILCVGETLVEREQGLTQDVVRRQLEAVIDVAGIESFEQAVLAYEPVWAIGTGRTASPEQAQEVHAFLRQMIEGHDDNIANSLRILYGGSVKAATAAELFGMTDVDGGLIGGASLKADEFLKICAAAG